MKKILLSLFLLLSLLFPSNSWATNWCNDANTIGCWLFGDGSGTTLTDETGVNNGTLVNSPTWGSVTGTNAPTYASGSLSFNGSNQYVNAGADASLLVDYITVTIWLYHSNTLSATETYISRHQASGPYGPWDMRRDGSYTKYGSAIAVASNNGAWSQNDGGTVIYDEWVHIAFSWDGTAGDVKLYTNGVEDGHCNSGCTLSGPLHKTAGNLNFGRNPSFGRYYDGLISETGMFNTAKDATDINDIMDNGLVQTAAATRNRLMIIQ